MRKRQLGVSIAIILVVLALVMVAFMATYALSRFTSTSNERAVTESSLRQAADALEQFAATAQRLPCPANPTLAAAAETGDEVRNGSNCTFSTGTVPWRTIGLKRDHSLDGWQRRISYRVYTGAAGSLVQDGGVSMVYCDTVDPGTGAREPGTGLCRNPGTEYERSTTPDKFLAGKGLRVSDMGQMHTDAAYVLISHGSTGYGAYTVSGAQLPNPMGDELGNTRATGDFTIKAFSAATVLASDAGHFDDLLAYRRLPELVSRIRLGARNWPDLSVSSLTFDLPSIAAASGNPSQGVGGTGASTLDFGSAGASGFTAGTASQLSYGTSSVTGAGGIGVIGTGSNPKISAFEGEAIEFLFDDAGTKLGLTLSDFGTYLFVSMVIERATIEFFNGSSLVHTSTISGCRADGALADFEIDAGVPYNKVRLSPILGTGGFFGFWESAFLVAAVKVCTASQAQCRSDLWAISNACP